MPDLSIGVIKVLDMFELITVIIFSVELILRLILSKPPLKYILSFYGVIDLLAVLPFYLSTGVDLRSVRIFRLFRLFRIFKLFKYNTAIDRLLSAFSEIKKELFIFIVATLFLLYLSSVGIYYFENAAQPEQFKSIFHSMWWAVATLTTVGYGDIYPITTGGKIFTFFMVFIGIGLVSIPTGLLASALSKTFNEK